MKGLTVIILLLFSLTISIPRFAKKANTDTDKGVEQTIKDLSSLKSILADSAHISFRGVNVTDEISFQAKYALIPRYVSTEQNEHFDTTLVIVKGQGDSIIAGKKILWQYADSPYHYYLTCKHP